MTIHLTFLTLFPKSYQHGGLSKTETLASGLFKLKMNTFET